MLVILVAFPEVQASCVGVDDAMRVGVDEAIRVGVDEAIRIGVLVGIADVTGVRDGLNPGMVITPSFMLNPLLDTLSVRSFEMFLISGPKAIQTPAPTRAARIAVRVYSTSPWPFSPFFVEYFCFIIFPIINIW